MWAFVIHFNFLSYFLVNNLKGKYDMKILGTVIIAAAVIYYIIFIVTLSKGGKFLRTALISALSGIAVLVVISLFSPILSINGWTVGISASFGVPGIIAMLATKLFF